MSFRIFLEKNHKIIGITASLMAVAMVLSSIEVLVSNIKGNSHIIIQPTITAFCSLVWGLYGISKSDKFIIIPNVLSLIISTATVIAYFY